MRSATVSGRDCGPDSPGTDGALLSVVTKRSLAKPLESGNHSSQTAAAPSSGSDIIDKYTSSPGPSDPSGLSTQAPPSPFEPGVGLEQMELSAPLIEGQKALDSLFPITRTSRLTILFFFVCSPSPPQVC